MEPSTARTPSDAEPTDDTVEDLEDLGSPPAASVTAVGTFSYIRPW